jgi:predicted ATPase
MLAYTRVLRPGRPGRTHTTKAAYQKLLAAGSINEDERQRRCVDALDALGATLVSYTPTPAKMIQEPTAAAPAASGGGMFSGWFSGPQKPQGKAAAAPPKKAPVTKYEYASPRGLYVYGGCGCGKSFLMDLFFDEIPIEKKRRIHFHEWMIEAHDLLHKMQKEGAQFEKANTAWTAEAAKAQRESLKSGGSSSASADDLVEKVADRMMERSWLLCFDEFQVTHISDAIIMKRLFEAMFSKGAVVIATSNRPPKDLYLNGLNRELFLPFIPLVESRCDVHNMDSQTDYRLVTEFAGGANCVFFKGLDSDTLRTMENLFKRLCKNEVVSSQITNKGRTIQVPKCGKDVRVAWFSFATVCDRALGAGDYLAIAEAFPTVFLDDVPNLTLQERDQVRRFITLVDTFYERKVKLIIRAGADAPDIFTFETMDKATAVQDEIFAWDRTVSRLIEMQSEDYLKAQAQEVPVEEYWAMFDLARISDDDIERIWLRYDDDGSKELDRKEFRKLAEDIIHATGGDRNISESVVEEIFQEVDTNQNGLVDMEEFRTFAQKIGVKKLASLP